MKSERRHELQTNELADWVGHQIDKIAPYSKAILGGIVAVVVAAIAFAIISYQQQTAAGLAWQSYLGALMERDVDSQVANLEEVASREGNTPAGIWAQQTQADLDLDRASRMLFTNRDEALKVLDRAQKSYENVEQAAAKNPALLERARFGLGQVFECQGSLEKAKAKYEQVSKAGTSDAFTKQAKKRLEAIQDPKVADFYAWFEKQKPAPPPPRGGRNLPGGLGGLGAPGAGGLGSGGLGDLPDRPDIKFPDFGAGDAKPAEEKPTEEKPTEEKPADDKPAEAPAEKPAAEKPAAEKPAAEKPAEEKPAEAPAEKPAAEKPAEEKPNR
ncbi:MAG: hypothetical protein U0939_15555 [Pirellulales bacterium]